MRARLDLGATILLLDCSARCAARRLMIFLLLCDAQVCDLMSEASRLPAFRNELFNVSNRSRRLAPRAPELATA